MLRNHNIHEDSWKTLKRNLVDIDFRDTKNYTARVYNILFSL